MALNYFRARYFRTRYLAPLGIGSGGILSGVFDWLVTARRRHGR